MDQGGQDRRPLDAPLLSPFPRERGPPAARGDRLQPRQSPAPAGVAHRHPGLVSHEPPAATLRDGWAADPARAVFHAAARRKLLDRGALSADSPAHRAARVAPDVIGRTAQAGSLIGAGRGVATEPAKFRKWPDQGTRATKTSRMTCCERAAWQSECRVAHSPRCNEEEDGPRSQIPNETARRDLCAG